MFWLRGTESENIVPSDQKGCVVGKIFIIRTNKRQVEEEEEKREHIKVGMGTISRGGGVWEPRGEEEQ